ncbi:hypothetical protein [Streptomyces sp. NPDC058045]|uniref:hypothetical protein n=1 Tax=Streptomyces sp. NPDC058045 TaxID=3346311 RepID=UPI0036E623C7
MTPAVRTALAVGLLTALGTAAAPAAHAAGDDGEARPPRIMAVLDASGSMRAADAGGGRTRIAAARQAVGALADARTGGTVRVDCSTGDPHDGASAVTEEGDHYLQVGIGEATRTRGRTLPMTVTVSTGAGPDDAAAATPAAEPPGRATATGHRLPGWGGPMAAGVAGALVFAVGAGFRGRRGRRGWRRRAHSSG